MPSALPMPTRSPGSFEGRALRHLAAAGAFAALAVVWTFPLAWHLSTHLPGPDPGDNLQFIWNFWWMRTALTSGLDFFHTTYLFAPTGADLTLHTHTALPAFLGATVLGTLSVVAAQNLMILVALFLNGFCAYLLAWRVTRDHGAALVGGIVFGGSPYLSAHLNGHFNLTTAWTIPLFAIALSEAIRGSTTGGRRQATKWPVLAGLLLGATAYIEYYYVVYEFALALCLAALAARDWSVALRGPSPRSRRLTKIVAVLILVDVATLAAIEVTGGIDARMGPIHISARDIFNPLQAFWVLVALSLWLWLRPRVEARRPEALTPARTARAILIMTGVFLVAAAPLVWKGVGLLLRGEYVTQQYFWRSAPKGIDVATLLLGNPFQSAWGGTVQRVYKAMGISVIESTGWLGVAPILLAAWALRRHARPTSSHERSCARRQSDPSARVVRRWAVIGLVFFVWSLGPHLMAFGMNTGMILPQTLLHYVPIVENARMPGRAIVVSYLALAVLAAITSAEWRRTSGHALLILVVVTLAIAADYLPAPFPLIALDRPAIYETLRDRPERGAVCELPLGLRDGFGERGSFDTRAFFYQTIHQRPLVGGYISRLPRAVVAAYESDPLLAGLLRLSERDDPDAARPLPGRERAADRLRENGIRFVVLNRRTASPALARYVERVLPLTLIAQEGDRSLYLVSR
jgi:hypothetical protein